MDGLVEEAVMESSAGGSCVGDALRELREALDSYRRIWPDSSIWIESSPGAAHIRLRRAVDAVLAVNLTTMEKRADRTEEWYERAIAAEAKVKELEQLAARMNSELRQWSTAAVAAYPTRNNWAMDPGNPHLMIGNIKRDAADRVDELTRQLAEEREACDAMRRRHGYPENFRGRTIHCCVTQAGDFRCSDCRAHDARREREKQNKGGAGEPAPRQTETAGPDIERDEESLRTSGASNHPQSAAITNNGGRPIGTGSGAAAVQSESTGEARSGGTPRVPANNRSGPHAAGDAAPILNKDETAQADPQTVASGLSTSNPPATVTEEDREMVVAAWKSHYGLTPLETITEIFATLLARVRSSARKELDEAVDVLGTMVEPLRYWAGYDGLCDRAAAIVNRHREVGR